MMDTGSVKLLQRLIAMGSTSLLQYVCESVPYSTDAAHADFDRVQTAAAEERDAIARLTRFLQKRHERLTKTGSYPSHFTTINFVSLNYLLPKLVAEHQREVAEIGAAISDGGDEEAQALAEGYLEMKRQHLGTLRELAARTTVGAA